jgi:hypothetical protein
MHELERLVRRAGGRFVGGRRHVRYLLDGVVITLKRGPRPCRQHYKATVSLVRKILKRRRP